MSVSFVLVGSCSKGPNVLNAPGVRGIGCACQRHDGPEELRRLTLEEQVGREGVDRRDRACVLGERRRNDRNGGRLLRMKLAGSGKIRFV